MAIHNPARIPVVAEIRRQELLAAARHERLCQSARADGARASARLALPRPYGTIGSVLAWAERALVGARRASPDRRAPTRGNTAGHA